MTTLRPEQIRVLVDTREQVPLDLAPLAMQRSTLATGDYALAAAPDHAIVERKSAQDLLAVIGRDRRRFEAELMRLRAYAVRVVLVEATWADLLNDPRTKLTPTQISGTISAWTARYTSFMFDGSRALAEDFARRFLYTASKRLWERAEAFRREVEQ